MSLSGAISSAVSALQAQATSLSIVSANLANSETTGYKASYASFESLVTGSGSSASSSSGGVLVSSRSNVTESGLLVATTSTTDLAIDGSGFFPVVAGTSGTEIYYTRNGAFELDDDGLLKNNGYYLVGWPTDADGNVIGGTTSGNLETIDVDAQSSYAAATTTETIVANLPANAAVGDTFKSSLAIYDSLGGASTATLTWTKTGENTWTATVADPVSSSDSTSTAGTVTSSAITISFNADGTLASTDPSPATVTVSGWASGAADSTITLDLGEVGSASGLSQYSSSADTLSVSATITQDGVAYGTISGVSVEDDGTVLASYSNGASVAIYKIPVATFTNANGLTEMSGAVYSVSNTSGTATLHIAGTEGAGTISGGTLESSTTDTNTEFSTMIAAQQAYSAAAQVMSTANDMYDTLLNAVS
jgi:flagellar hook protein FlgE